MARLKDRNHQIPNGFLFYQPETGWKPPAFSSFQTIVDSLIMHRKANPYLITKNGWSVDPAQVADEVDNFNARVCQQMGWSDYIDGAAGGGSPVPFPQTPQVHQGRLSQLVAGGKTLVKWIASGAEAVAPELANKRAAICADCTLNGKGPWTAFFTVPVATAIQDAVELRRQMNLSTTSDDRLGVCDACSCPLKLKVHMGIDRILADMERESFDSLVPNCWIRSEKK